MPFGSSRSSTQQLPAVFDPEEALKPDAPILHGASNLFQRHNVRQGDIEKGFAGSPT